MAKTVLKECRTPEDLCFEDIATGLEASFTHIITRSDLELFIQITGDYNPLHHDENFARQTMFEGRIIPGMLTASLISRLIGMFIPGKRAIYLSQDMKFIKPVRIGDSLLVKGTVTEKQTGKRNVVMLKTEIFNQDCDLVLTGTAKTALHDDNTTKNTG